MQKVALFCTLIFVSNAIHAEGLTCAGALSQAGYPPATSIKPSSFVGGPTSIAQHYQNMETQIALHEKNIGDAESTLRDSPRKIQRASQELNDLKTSKLSFFKKKEILQKESELKAAENELTLAQEKIKEEKKAQRDLRILQHNNLKQNPGLAFVPILDRVRKDIARGSWKASAEDKARVELALKNAIENPRSVEEIYKAYDVLSLVGYPHWFSEFNGSARELIEQGKPDGGGSWVRVFDINGEESGAGAAVDSLLVALNRDRSPAQAPLTAKDIRREAFWDSNEGVFRRNGVNQSFQFDDPHRQVPRVVLFSTQESGKKNFVRAEAATPMGFIPTAEGGVEPHYLPQQFKVSEKRIGREDVREVTPEAQETAKKCMYCHSGVTGLFNIRPQGIKPQVFKGDALRIIQSETP